jgi:murein DD-endopeptidase MepM/ murein hydrolase activator NlpD
VSFRGLLSLAIVVALCGAGVWLAGTDRVRSLFEAIGVSALAPTPHDRYARSLRSAGLSEAALGRQWLAAADASLAAAERVEVPRREAMWFAAAAPRAVALKATLRRGQRTAASASVTSGTPASVFLDLFEYRDGGFEAVSHADEGATDLVHEITRDGEYLLRIQPELLQDARVEIEWRIEPTLALPVRGGTRGSIQSYFRAPRDGGAREHHGVDIFAARGTPVLAAADGIVTSVGTNTLGGNVVWVARPLRRESLYYAHLDTQSATTGDHVKAGDVLGTVGATGNAAGGPPHLHFGIYTRGGPVDPLPYLDPARNREPGPLLVAFGEVHRLRAAQRIAGRALPTGTIVEVVGATAAAVRVRLPDGAEGYAPARATASVGSALRALRVPRQAALANSPVGGIRMNMLTAGTRVEVLGTFGDALYVRTAGGLWGWIAKAAAA